MNLVPWRTKDRGNATGLMTPLNELRSEMDRLFDSFMREPFGSLGGTLEPNWSPPLDVSESDQEVTVRAEIPGVDPKDLEVSVTGNRLTIAGEKKESEEKKCEDCYHRETRHGSFRRVIALPMGVDAENVSAEHSNGVVTIKLKKTQTAASKQIPIKTS